MNASKPDTRRQVPEIREKRSDRRPERLRCGAAAPGHRLRMLDNVVLTPHLGSVTREAYARFYGQTLEYIRAYLAGQPTRVLNPDVLQRLRPPPVA